MTGRGHLATGAVASTYLLYLPLQANEIIVLFAGVMIGSVFPDRVEKIGPVRILPHRGISHWLGLWMAIVAGLIFHLNEVGLQGNEVLLGVLGLAMGSILHVLGDVPNYQKVPLILPKPSFSLGWWKSGQYEPLIISSLLVPHLIMRLQA